MSSAGHDYVPELLNFWEYQCGVAEPQIRARLLYVIALNAYRSELWDTLIYEEMDQYRYRLEFAGRNKYSERFFRSNAEFFGFVPPNSLLDSFTKEFSRHYLRYTDLQPSERLILTALAGLTDDYFDLMRHTDSDSSLHAALYRSELEHTLAMKEGFGRIGLGIWSPGGRSELLGSHPVFLLDAGSYAEKWGWEIDFEIRFLKSRDSFDFKNKHVDLYTDRFSGWGLNLCYTRNLSKLHRNRLNLKAGFGWDALAISVLTETDVETYDKLYFANSPSAILGLEWVMRTGNGTWTVGYTRHFMDYSLSKRTDLDGFANSLKVGYGFIDNDTKRRKLQQLHFDPYSIRE